MTIQESPITNKRLPVEISGSIYREEADAIMKHFIGLLRQGHIAFIVDFAAVDYIDSAGIGTLLAIHKRAREQGGGMMIKGLNGIVKELFLLTSVENVFDME